jgi:hypothetical protein
MQVEFLLSLPFLYRLLLSEIKRDGHCMGIIQLRSRCSIIAMRRLKKNRKVKKKHRLATAQSWSIQKGKKSYQICSLLGIWFMTMDEERGHDREMKNGEKELG